jgi:hypothetical protein
MSIQQNPIPVQDGIVRREFIKRAAVGAGAVAMGMVALGCSSSGSTPAAAGNLGAASAVPTQNAWKFGVMADTQWLSADDGQNPNTCAVGLLLPLQQAFIAQHVKFVVQVGDLADQASGPSSEAGYATTASLCEDTRALFAQGLYSAGIGFFPVRGNHDNGSPAEFVNIFPQTQNGQMNATPASVFSITNPDTVQPSPTQGGSSFTQGTNFAAIGYPPNYQGLSYGFDYNNARFVLIDQFATVSGNGPDGNAYDIDTTVSLQQAWINAAYAGKPANGHIFNFSHKGIILQQHIDVLFGDCPSDAAFSAPANTATGAAALVYNVAPGAANVFIRSMASNASRFLFCGHDHNHNRCLVNTTDGNTPADHITQVLCQSVSSKFYTPNEDDSLGNSNVTACTSNDVFFCAGKRQTQLSSELYTVGYYIVTVDGPNVTVDYYSAPAFPTYGGNTQNLITATPTLAFTKRETFGYSLIGQQFIVPTGSTLAVVQDTGPSGTIAAILGGTNTNPNTDASGRKYANDVNTGWITGTAATASDILLLWGMGITMGSRQTDIYALSMSYNPAKGTSFVLATPDADGNWTKAVDQNAGGALTLVNGPWQASYGLGTYGINTANHTVWAVLNFNGCFAAVPTA